MKREMTIVYDVHNGLYINLTNRCPCACTFYLRQTIAEACVKTVPEGCYDNS